MKKAILLFLMFLCVKSNAQTIVTQAQIFQKWISVHDSLILVNIPTGLAVGTLGYTSTGKIVKPSQPPIATLNGGTVYELTVTNPTTTLAWTYSRNTLTAPIVSAVINPGNFNEFSSPTSGSGTQNVTTTANTNTTYNFLVTSQDGSTINPTTSVTFLPRFYYGRSSSSTPNQTIVLAVAGGGSTLSNSKAQNSLLITASGSNYPYFAYPSSEGAINNIFDVNGFNVTSAFNQTTVSITNASGFTQSYFIYTLNAATSGNYTITTN